MCLTLGVLAGAPRCLLVYWLSSAGPCTTGSWLHGVAGWRRGGAAAGDVEGRSRGTAQGVTTAAAVHPCSLRSGGAEAASVDGLGPEGTAPRGGADEQRGNCRDVIPRVSTPLRRRGREHGLLVHPPRMQLGDMYECRVSGRWPAEGKVASAYMGQAARASTSEASGRDGAEEEVRRARRDARPLDPSPSSGVDGCRLTGAVRLTPRSGDGPDGSGGQVPTGPGRTVLVAMDKTRRGGAVGTSAGWA
jgi:hypothetical protein